MSAARTYFETATGRMVNLLAPHSRDVHITDIGHALSQVCRYGGHSSRFYSVAEHCVLVHDLVKRSSGAHLALPALLHDAHEAYLGDLPTPLKHCLGQPYRDMAGQWDYAIANRFGFSEDDFHAEPVRWADAAALRLEAHVLKQSKGEDSAWLPAWQEWGLETVPEELLRGREFGIPSTLALRRFLGAFAAAMSTRAARV